MKELMGGRLRKINEKGDRILWKQLALLTIMAWLVYREFIAGEYLYMIPSDARDQFVMEIRDLLRLFSESGLPMWSFYKGLGQQATVGNPLWTGDIFTLTSLLICRENFVYLWGIIAAIKVVLAGLFFYLFLRELGISPHTRCMISLAYAFNGHMLCRGIWIHYATEVVFAALWLWALERFHRGKKLLFPVALAILFLSRNAAYVYIYSGLSFFYVIIRHVFFEGYTWRELGQKLLKFSGYYLWGLAMSAVLVIPGILWILQSNRLPDDGSIFSNLLQIATTDQLSNSFISLFTNGAFGSFTTTGYSGVILEDPTLYTGILTAIIFPQLFFFKNAKKHEKIACAVLIGCVFAYSLFPFLREFCNAFSTGFYKTSSFWSIIFLLIVCAYILDAWEERQEVISRPVLIGTVFVELSLIAVITWSYGEDLNFSVISVAAVFIVLITAVLCSKTDWRRKRSVIYVLCTVEILGSAQGLLTGQLLDTAPILSSWQEQYEDDSVSELLKSIPDEDFYRIDSNFQSSACSSYNWAQYYGYYGVSSYVSIQPGEINHFYNLFEIDYPNEACFPGVSERSLLDMLLGVRYYLYDTSAGGEIPDGYTLVDSAGKYELYKSENARSLGYLYDSYVLESEFEALTVPEKDMVALQSVIVSDALPHIRKETVEKDELPLDLEIIETANLQKSDEFTLDHMEYNSENVDPMIVMRLNSEEKLKSGKYVITCDITSENATGGQVYYWGTSGEANGENVEIFSVEPGTHSYEIFFEFDEPMEYLRFDVGDCAGKFTIENFSLVELDAEIDIGSMNQEENALQIYTFSQNHITGHVSVDHESILFLSIPYDSGWSVKANGVEQEVLIADGAFLAVDLPAGEYEIELSYMTPGLLLGAALSGGAFLAWCVYVVLTKRKK